MEDTLKTKPSKLIRETDTHELIDSETPGILSLKKVDTCSHP